MARLFGKNSEIQIPPQSTGPRILNHIYQTFALTSISGGTVTIGQSIVGGTSGATGTIQVVNTETSTDVLVLFDPSSPVQSFTASESVTINGTITATAGTPIDLYVNTTQVVDGDNPHHTQRVDAEGSAHVRFGEGEQQLDAFGITRVTQRTLLDAFKFQYSPDASGLEDVIVAGGTRVHVQDEASVTLNTTTGATDSIIRSGEHWYPYIPGVGREVVQTLAVGDSGKANNVRRWGLFDDDNGVFFELDGTTFNAVVRSNVTGTPVNTKIAQADWNGDTLDGSGGVSNRTSINLDLTAFNIYWIDYAWLGTGRIRFGIYAPNGDRITCHIVENSNIRPTVYMTTASLPVRWENTNSGVTSGNSSIKIACAAIVDNAQQQDPQYFRTHAYARSNVNVTAEAVLFNIRTATTFGGVTNRIISRGLLGSTASESAPALIRIYEEPTIGGVPSWSAPHSSSPLEVDTAGTTSGGDLVAAFMVGVNETDTQDLSFLKIHTDVAGTTSKVYSVTAESLGAATDVSSTFTWLDSG